MQSKWVRVKLNNLQDDRIDEHPDKGGAHNKRLPGQLTRLSDSLKLP